MYRKVLTCLVLLAVLCVPFSAYAESSSASISKFGIFRRYEANGNVILYDSKADYSGVNGYIDSGKFFGAKLNSSYRYNSDDLPSGFIFTSSDSYSVMPSPKEGSSLVPYMDNAQTQTLAGQKVRWSIGSSPEIVGSATITENIPALSDTASDISLGQVVPYIRIMKDNDEQKITSIMMYFTEHGKTKPITVSGITSVRVAVKEYGNNIPRYYTQAEFTDFGLGRVPVFHTIDTDLTVKKAFSVYVEYEQNGAAYYWHFLHEYSNDSIIWQDSSDKSISQFFAREGNTDTVKIILSGDMEFDSIVPGDSKYIRVEPYTRDKDDYGHEVIIAAVSGVSSGTTSLRLKYKKNERIYTNIIVTKVYKKDSDIITGILKDTTLTPYIKAYYVQSFIVENEPLYGAELSHFNIGFTSDSNSSFNDLNAVLLDEDNTYSLVYEGDGKFYLDPTSSSASKYFDTETNHSMFIEAPDNKDIWGHVNITKLGIKKTSSILKGKFVPYIKLVRDGHKVTRLNWSFVNAEKYKEVSPDVLKEEAVNDIHVWIDGYDYQDKAAQTSYSGTLSNLDNVFDTNIKVYFSYMIDDVQYLWLFSPMGSVGKLNNGGVISFTDVGFADEPNFLQVTYDTSGKIVTTYISKDLSVELLNSDSLSSYKQTKLYYYVLFNNVISVGKDNVKENTNKDDTSSILAKYNIKAHALKEGLGSISMVVYEYGNPHSYICAGSYFVHVGRELSSSTLEAVPVLTFKDYMIDGKTYYTSKDVSKLPVGEPNIDLILKSSTPYTFERARIKEMPSGFYYGMDGSFDIAITTNAQTETSTDTVSSTLYFDICSIDYEPDNYQSGNVSADYIMTFANLRTDVISIASFDSSFYATTKCTTQEARTYSGDSYYYTDPITFTSSNYIGTGKLLENNAISNNYMPYIELIKNSSDVIAIEWYFIDSHDQKVDTKKGNLGSFSISDAELTCHYVDSSSKVYKGTSGTVNLYPPVSLSAFDGFTFSFTQAYKNNNVNVPVQYIWHFKNVNSVNSIDDTKLSWDISSPYLPIVLKQGESKDITITLNASSDINSDNVRAFSTSSILDVKIIKEEEKLKIKVRLTANKSGTTRISLILEDNKGNSHVVLRDVWIYDAESNKVDGLSDTETVDTILSRLKAGYDTVEDIIIPEYKPQQGRYINNDILIENGKPITFTGDEVSFDELSVKPRFAVPQDPHNEPYLTMLDYVEQLGLEDVKLIEDENLTASKDVYTVFNSLKDVLIEKDTPQLLAVVLPSLTIKEAGYYTFSISVDNIPDGRNIFWYSNMPSPVENTTSYAFGWSDGKLSADNTLSSDKQAFMRYDGTLTNVIASNDAGTIDVSVYFAAGKYEPIITAEATQKDIDLISFDIEPEPEPEPSPDVVPVITKTTLKSGTVGIAYRDNLTADHNNVSWSITSGDIPDGLVLNKNTGEIAGTPKTDGTYVFTTTVTLDSASASKDFSITIAPASVVISEDTEVSPDIPAPESDDIPMVSEDVEVDIPVVSEDVKADVPEQTTDSEDVVAEIPETPTVPSVVTESSDKPKPVMPEPPRINIETMADNIKDILRSVGSALSSLITGDTEVRELDDSVFGEERNVDDISEEDLARIPQGEKPAAVLPIMRVDTPAVYVFGVSLSHMQVGVVIHLRMMSEPVDGSSSISMIFTADDEEEETEDTCVFLDDDGNETNTVPENKHVNIAAYMEPDYTYAPIITQNDESEVIEDSEVENNLPVKNSLRSISLAEYGPGDPQGGCDVGMSIPALIVMAFALISRRKK